jgi:hypothetical protein
VGSRAQGAAGPAPRSPALGARPGGHPGGGGGAARPPALSAAPRSRPARRRAVRPAPQGAGTGRPPSRAAAGALGPRRPSWPAPRQPRGVRASAEAPPRPTTAPAGSRTSRAARGRRDGSSSLGHRGTLTSEAPPAATAAGTAAVASAAAAPSAVVRTGASPRGHSPPAAAAALPSPVSGLGSGTTPGSPRRHFDSDREQEGLASRGPGAPAPLCGAGRPRPPPLSARPRHVTRRRRAGLGRRGRLGRRVPRGSGQEASARAFFWLCLPEGGAKGRGVLVAASCTAPGIVACYSLYLNGIIIAMQGKASSTVSFPLGSRHPPGVGIKCLPQKELRSGGKFLPGRLCVSVASFLLRISKTILSSWYFYM